MMDREITGDQPSQPFETFTERVLPWLLAAFGEKVTYDKAERNHRFLEEALELVQACGCTSQEAHGLVDYVFGRPVGEVNQELGGVMVSLAALCMANKLDLPGCAETELARVWLNVEKIRSKQDGKPREFHNKIAELEATIAKLKERNAYLSNANPQPEKPPVSL